MVRVIANIAEQEELRRSALMADAAPWPLFVVGVGGVGVGAATRERRGVGCVARGVDAQPARRHRSARTVAVHDRTERAAAHWTLA